MDQPTPFFSDRVYVNALRRVSLTPIALRAIGKATQLFGLVHGQNLGELRSSKDPLQRGYGVAKEHETMEWLHQETAEILGRRLDRIPERQRPHYMPEERARILRVKHLLSLSCAETARLFRLAGATVARWERAIADGHAQRLVRHQPPVRRYANVVRELVRTMAISGFGGNGQIARTLARAGWKISETTVGRCRKEKPTQTPRTEVTDRRRPWLRPSFVHQLWLTDLTQVKSLFGLVTFRVGTIFDAYSRMPLFSRSFEAEPTAGAMASFFRRAVALYQRPRYFISDKGSQFVGAPFRQALERAGVVHRFGRLGERNSSPLIERFWLTLKETAQLKHLRPLLKQDLDRRMNDALTFYVYHRPHMGLGGATPAEVYFKLRRAHRRAIQPPRGRPGDPTAPRPFQIEYLDEERRLPILVKVA